jgi:hypothetical protein
MLTDFGSSGIETLPTYAWLALLGGAATHFWPPAITAAAHRAFLRAPTVVIGVLVGIAAGCVAVLVVGETPYIYFQF